MKFKLFTYLSLFLLHFYSFHIFESWQEITRYIIERCMSLTSAMFDLISYIYD